MKAAFELQSRMFVKSAVSRYVQPHEGYTRVKDRGGARGRTQKTSVQLLRGCISYLTNYQRKTSKQTARSFSIIIKGSNKHLVAADYIH